MNASRLFLRSALLALAPCLALFGPTAHADTATWSNNPFTEDWNTAANWEPATIPNGSTDSAIFGVSAGPAITITGQPIEVAGLTFGPGASAFTIVVAAAYSLDLSGAGISNSSGQVQNLVIDASKLGSLGSLGELHFNNSASAGDRTVFTCIGGVKKSFGHGGLITFFDNSSAGAASFVIKGGTNSSFGGETRFRDTSSAGKATFTVEAGLVDSGGGGLTFFDTATAGNATVVLNGGTAPHAGVGHVSFLTGAVSHATIIANGGSNGGEGSYVSFDKDSPGNLTRVKLFGNASLSIAGFSGDPATVGSIEGNGSVELGDFNLTLGGNNLDTEFAGLIQNVFSEFDGGSLTKIGKGCFILSGTNTFNNGVVIEGGALVVTNSAGSATGSGRVWVQAGTLGGNGIIGGNVIVGTGTGAGSFLAPSFGPSQPRTLTLQKTLTFKSDGVYTYKLKARRKGSRSDQVIAKGVTIENEAQFNFLGQAQGELRQGTTFTVISNTAATPISGTFVNLPDGATLNINGNNLQASYEGGDGNDLTLTVGP